MSLSTIAVNSTITTNELAPITEPWEAEQGIVEVGRSDENEVTVHFRHYNNEQASISASMDRAGAVALAHSLLAAAEADG